ncbi:MAG: alkaline phosphatase family protein [Actinomycetota bacterium]
MSRALRSRVWTGVAALALLGAAAAPGGSPALADSSAQQNQETDALVKAACDIPRVQLVRMWRGTRPDWGGDLLMLPQKPDFVSGGISHAGPWNYLQEVPLFWYGPPFIKPGVVNRPVISTDIAPTEGAILNYQFHAPDGEPLPEIFPSQRPNNLPRLLVTLVWDGGGMDVLNTWNKDWPYLKNTLMKKGSWFSNVTIGSSPSNTPPIHSTIGTGAYPRASGTLDEFLRIGDEIEKPNDRGPAFQLVPTFADLYDRAMNNKPVVGGIATLSAHLGMLGHGSMWGGGDKDIAVTRENVSAPTGGAESVKWNLAPHMAPYYTFPKYVNQVPGFQRDKEQLDAADGAKDGMWRTNNIDQLLGGFDTPARVPYQTRVIESLIKREHFGADKVPDLLYINYKTIDTIGHQFTINSPEMSDAVRYQDQYLKVLVDFLNKQVGQGKWAMVLTADHGHQFSPTVSGAWQIDVTHMEQDINQHFAIAGSDASVIEKMRPTQVWLDTDLLAQRGFTVADVASYMMTLTEQDTTKRSTTPEPGHADDPVFKSVVPLQVFDKLPCLPQGETP